MDNLTDIPDQTLEQLRCSQCKKYLSCSPVRLLDDGTCICGQCSPLNTATGVHRVLALEVALKTIPFPCCFKEQGCKELVIFDQAIEHELKCSYRPYSCPLSSLLHCTWDGSALQIQDHFTVNHSSCLFDNVSFTIEVDQNSQGIFAALNEGVVSLVTYSYQADSRNLNYDIRYFSSIDSVSVLYNVQLCNDLLTNCNMSLKKTPCSLFDETFNNPGSVLNLSKYLECLDYPIKVKVNVNVEVSNLSQKTVDETVRIDYDKLDTLRCGECKAYLALPIFDESKEGSPTCYHCAQRFGISTESTDVKLQRSIAETIYPCRWRSCSFISKGDAIAEHEKSCHLRDYRCFIPSCSSLYTIAAAKEHLEKHGAQYMDNNTYTISLETSEMPQIQFTIENNRLFVLEHNIYDRNSYEISFHDMRVLLDSFVDHQKNIHFEHEHCKLRSRKYPLHINSFVQLKTCELPPCFLKGDLLYVKLTNIVAPTHC